MNGKKLLIVILLLLLAAGAGYFMLQKSDGTTEIPTSEQTDEVIPEDESTLDNVGSDALDLQQAMQPRILGNPNAPIKISEHSSFTCGHCGKFHREYFPQVKAALIDTGKAYIVFNDFPLNAPALHASMTARCLPDTDRYFDFVQMLFEDQENWAYERNYLDILKTKAADYGLSAAGFKACLENEELQKAIVAGAKAAQTQWNVNSTPSFVVNNKTLISGALAPEAFVEKVNEAVSGSGTPDETEPEPSE